MIIASKNLRLPVVVFGVLYAACWLLQPWLTEKILHTGSNTSVTALVVFSVAWVGVIYGFFSLWSRGFCRISWRELYVYVGMMSLIGPVGEVFVNSLCRLATGSPLWEYRVLPVGHGDTSAYSFVAWSLYGFYFYLLQQRHNNIGGKNDGQLALRVSVEGLALEFLMNLSSLACLHVLVFYYFPPDMGHLTTLLAAPFYFLAGLLMVKTIKRFQIDPVFFGTLSLVISATFVFLCD